MARPWLQALADRRFLLLSLFTVVAYAIGARDGDWIADFWEHAAVVRELSTHPFSPRHPQLSLDAPHPFFSPYSVTLGLLARFTATDALDLLPIAGAFNLALLLVGLRLFIGSLAPGRGSRAAFYSLLLILFLGGEKWAWSSFFNVAALRVVPPYPSTFAAGLSFLMLGLYARSKRSDLHLWHCLPATVGLSVVLVTHPLTAVLLYIGLIVIAVDRAGLRPRAEHFAVGLCIGASVLLALVWPYYPFWSLVSRGDEFHGQSLFLYEGVLERVWPVLFGVPVLIQRFSRRRTDRLVWIFLGLVFVYAYGFASDRFGYGRVISFAMIALQIALGCWLAGMEGSSRRAVVWGAWLVLLGIVATSREDVRRLVEHRSTLDEHEFLREHVGQYDLVLADVRSSWRIPANGGKVVATLHPLYWVEDMEERRRDAETFFAPEATRAEREAILDEYRPDFILMARWHLRELEELSAFGTAVDSNWKFRLLRVDARPGDEE